MTKTNSKKALLSSAFALVLSVAMLIGTTFAWFTDTASTGVNKIQSGTLKVDIVNENGNSIKGKSMSFVNKEGSADILWEPGVTFKTTGFKIKNIGNLALKYKLALNGVTGDNKLLEVIKFTVVDGNDNEVDLDTFNGHLDATDAMSDLLYIKAHMDEAAGNDYQGRTLEGLGITVLATQYTYENDSFGNTYDENAMVTAADYDALAKAAKSGGLIKLGADVDAEATLTFGGDAHLDLAGKTLNNTSDIWKGNDWSLISAQNGVDVVIDGNGTVKAKENDCYAVDVQDGSTVTIKNGTFVGNIHAVYVHEGTAIIEGGTYSVQQKYSDASKADEFVLNCLDTNRANGTAKIIVRGGTFINFNPADCQAEGAHTNFVADGYSVVSEKKANGDVWYTVIEGNAVNNGNELAAAVKANGKVVLMNDVNLSAAIEIPTGKDVTIDLNGKTVTATSDFAVINADAKLTVKGGKVISGRYALNAKGGEVIVNDGDFTAQECVYALFGGSKLTVNGGTFTAKDNSVISTNGSSAEGCEITVNGGVFNANITSAGYIACGVYVANKDTVNINGGIFNVTDGVGVLMRAGHTTIGENVVINLINTGKITAGKIGDAKIDITTPSHLVMDVRSGYPGAAAGFTITNNSKYNLVEYK